MSLCCNIQMTLGVLRKVCVSTYTKMPSRNVLSLINRWSLKSFKTKYISTITCICGVHISPEHILMCKEMKQYLPPIISEDLFQYTLSYEFFKCLLYSPIGSFL